MADVLQVVAGHVPWAPAPDAALVKEYEHHDVPLTGILERHGVRFYFTAVTFDPDEPVSFWLYTLIPEEIEAALDAASSADEFDEVEVLDGPAVIALVIDEVGIVSGHVITDVEDVSQLDQAYKALTSSLSTWAASARDLIPC